LKEDPECVQAEQLLLPRPTLAVTLAILVSSSCCQCAYPA
jgi:hypothetical protein